jgi:hypothetical protein
MAFLQNIEVNYTDPFIVKDLSFAFDNPLSTSSNSVSASIFGLDPLIPLVSGSLRQENIYLQWKAERPISKNLISGYISDEGFSGFLINFYDKNRNLLYQDPIVFNQTEYSKTISDVLDVFTPLTGQDNLTGLNEFFIDIVSVNVSGLYSTGIALVNFTSSTLNISSLLVSTNSILNLDYSDKNSIKDVEVFVTSDSDFNSASGNYLYNYKATFPNTDIIEIPDLSTLNSYSPVIISDNLLRQPYYVHLLPSTYFGTGALITSSGIKTSSYNISSLPDKIENITGYVYFDFNDKSKDLNLNALVKWDSVSQSQDCNFHILVEESGKNKTK